LRVGADNPLASAVRALFRAAAHPGDRAAWEQVKMSPAWAVLEAERNATGDGLTRRLLQEIHAEGFERTVEAWVRKLEPALAADDDFSRERGRQLAEAARLFDETGSRDVAEFCQFVEHHTVREADTAAVVRVMTVHKAKGLGFDLVVLPDWEGQKLAQRRRGLAVQRARDRSVEWVLDLPPEIFYAQDPVLSAHVAGAEADACYEELAVLYVAMTRAKRAMYLITEPVGKSKSHNFPRLLRETLGEEWSEGDARWFEAAGEAAAEPPPEAGLPTVAAARAVRRPAKTPSELKAGEVGGARLFVLESGGAAEFGRAVHGLLAQVEWAGAEEEARLAQAWSAEGEAGAEALRCLRAAELAEVWAKPAGAVRVELWRERAFEGVLDGAWVSGIFDRVVIGRSESGRVEQAVVYDFKTDRGAEADLARATERHEGQLALYRRVVAMLTGLPVAAVRAKLVFTEPGRSVTVSADA
jgi:ATP-dependent exoDNAse (exonuclease V) beta subunit